MSSEQVKAQLAEARALIQQKRYADARKVLKRIDDPTARQWEAKLDSIAPIAPSASRPIINYAIFTVIGAIVGLLIGLAVGHNLGRQSVGQEIASWFNGSSLSTPGTPSSVQLTATGIEVANADSLNSAVTTATAAGATNEAAQNTINATATASAACDPQGWWNTVDEPVARFLDTAKTATSTSRISLSPIILEMRQAYRDFDNADHPDCMDEVYYEVRAGMNAAIEGFESFMADSEFVSTIELGLATRYFYNAYAGLLKNGAVGTSDMFNTSVYIWGGDEPTNPKATEWYLTRQAPSSFELTITAEATSAAKLAELYSTATAAFVSTSQASNP